MFIMFVICLFVFRYYLKDNTKQNFIPQIDASEGDIAIPHDTAINNNEERKYNINEEHQNNEYRIQNH